MSIPGAPDVSHLRSSAFKDSVYEPAEDTFLMADALEADGEFLCMLRPSVCVELGGSGYLSAFVAKILEQTARDVLYICTDRNVLAAKATETTGRLNNIILNPLQTDFCAGLVNRLKHSVDLMIFNPPYVVTPSDEIQSSDPIFWSWAGGVDGREVLDRFLDQSLPDVRVPS